jgi:GTPase involved in cell partitioning and DNA repair
LSKYDKKILKKTEIIVLNKLDLVDMKEIKKELEVFKKRIKKDFEIISVATGENFERAKKVILKKCI